MDQALALIESGRAREGVRRAVDHLAMARRTLGRTEWQSFARDVRTHPIADHVYADPFTHRAFSKPRGYPGDAVMMDYLYGLRDAHRATLGASASAVFDYSTNWAETAQSVRARRARLAAAIDAVSEERQRAVDVVAFAAGHLREAELSRALAQGRARITAVDADRTSLEEVTRRYGALGVASCHGSVRLVLTGRLSLPSADLVYSAGLYDYLSDAVAGRLTQALFDAVRPGGTLLLANFLPDVPDAGYMEAFMDWHLVYRTDRQMLGLVDALPAASVGGVRVCHGPLDHITYLEVRRR